MNDQLLTAREAYYKASNEYAGADALHSALVAAGALGAEGYSLSRRHVDQMAATKSAAWRAYIAEVRAQRVEREAAEHRQYGVICVVEPAAAA